MNLIADAVIFLGIVFSVFGVIGNFRFKDFYARILVAAKVDTVGAITLFCGVILKHGWGFFALKILLLLGVMFLINPITAHAVARAAHLSGYNAAEAEGEEGDL